MDWGNQRPLQSQLHALPLQETIKGLLLSLATLTPRSLALPIQQAPTSSLIRLSMLSSLTIDEERATQEVNILTNLNITWSAHRPFP